MAEKNSSRRVESSLKRTRFLGHLGLIVGVFRELEVDKVIDEKLPKGTRSQYPSFSLYPCYGTQRSWFHRATSVPVS